MTGRKEIWSGGGVREEANVLGVAYSQNGNTQTYAYNSGTSRYDQAYFYDLIGNVTAVSDKTPDCGLPNDNDSLQRLFEYDALYRLLQATGREENNVNNQYWTDPPQAGTPNANNCRNYTQRYEYNEVGNIKNLIHAANGNNWTKQYNYQAENNKLNSIDDGQGTPTSIMDFTYDNNGNQTTANSDRYYKWNYSDRMKCFYIAASGSISKFAHYLYDAGGQRTKKLVINQAGGYDSVTYIDGVFEYHKKVTTSTSEEKNYIQIQGGIEIRVGAYSDDGNEDITYTISDYLSSAVIRLTDNGSILDKEEFYPYGETSLRTFGKKRYRFTGKERDNESGLYYYGARYYEAWSGKFLSIDPMIAKTPALSPYCYANCNPLVFNDPSGMEGEQQTGGGGASSSGGGGESGSSSGADNMQCGEPPANPTDNSSVGTEIKVNNTPPSTASGDTKVGGTGAKQTTGSSSKTAGNKSSSDTSNSSAKQEYKWSKSSGEKNNYGVSTPKEYSVNATNTPMVSAEKSGGDFDKFYSEVLSPNEGGWKNDPQHDSQDPTNRGITWPTFQETAKSLLNIEPTVENLKNLTHEQAKTIYKNMYWDKIKASEIKDSQIAYMFADFYVNAGGNATKVLQNTLQEKGYDIQVDGAFGKNSLATLNQAIQDNPEQIFNAFKDNRISYYNNLADSNPRMYEIYRNGWLNRANSFNYKK